MKQGTGRHTDSARKIEPRSKGIAPGAAAGIGIQEIRYRKPDGGGKAYKAPMNSQTYHPRGTQGKH